MDKKASFVNVDFSLINELLDFLGALSVNSAAKGNTCSENFLNSAGELNSHTLGSELLSDVNDIVHLEVTVVLDVLLLLSVSWTFLKSLDNKWGSGWEDSDETLSVLDHHFNLNFDSSPITGGLLDIFTDLLWWHTEGTTLGSEGSG